jgi:hypothetical protein
MSFSEAYPAPEGDIQHVAAFLHFGLKVVIRCTVHQGLEWAESTNFTKAQVRMEPRGTRTPDLVLTNFEVHELAVIGQTQPLPDNTLRSLDYF